MARNLWRWLTPNRKGHRIASVLSAFAAERSEVFFIQIGSNDGDHGDPLKRNACAHGWSGILVEPVPYVFARLRANRGSLHNLALENVAIGPTVGSVAFTTLLIRPTRFRMVRPVRLLPSLQSDQARRTHPGHRESHRRNRSPMHDLGLVVQETRCSQSRPAACRRGGLRFRDHQLIDFERYAPDLLLYEHKHLSPQDYTAVASCWRSTATTS